MTVIGKPSETLQEMVKNKYDFKPEKTIFFGDELNSDIVFAHKMGWSSAFVATGRDSLEQVRESKGLEKPDFILKNLREILI